MRATTVVFGSRDAAGYATRVSIVAGPVAGGTSSGGASSAPPLGSTTAAPGAFDAVLAILLGGGQR
jgi:hypothetical protein